MARAMAVLVWVALLAAACGGSASENSTGALCSPDGTALSITVKNTAYSKSCLATPADTAFTISFDNQDPGVPHSIHVFTNDPRDDPGATSLFQGEVVTGTTIFTYEVGALAPGTYHFHCDVHPDVMFGTFVVG